MTSLTPSRTPQATRDHAQEDAPGRTTKRIGRSAGLFLLIQTLVAPVIYTEFWIMSSILSPQFLQLAAPNAATIRIALLLVLLLPALAIAVAIVVLPLFRRYSEHMAFAFLALSIVGLALQGPETHTLRTMLSLSIAYHAGSIPGELLEALGRTERYTWWSAHFTNLMLGHLKMLQFYSIVYRFLLLPRWLAGVGVTATLLSTSAAVMSLLQYPFSYAMVAPTALVQIVLVTWLLTRGFVTASSETTPVGMGS